MITNLNAERNTWNAAAEWESLRLNSHWLFFLSYDLFSTLILSLLLTISVKQGIIDKIKINISFIRDRVKPVQFSERVLKHVLYSFKFGMSYLVYGPEEWGRKAPLCNGKSQSPIDIVSSSAQENASYKSLELTFHNRDGKVAGILSNNGHAPTLLIDKSNGSVTLKGGPLGKASYILEQFHFHFGCDNNHGSEHTVDGTSYPSEVFCFCWFFN